MKQEPQFESIIQELETTITDLEQSIGLEDALKKYQKGMALAKEAEGRLKQIENQFEKLQVEFKSSENEEKRTESEKKVITGEIDLSNNSSDEGLDTLPF